MAPVRPADRFLIFGAPSIGDEEISEVVACLQGGWLGTGPRTSRFANEFASYKGVEQAVAVNSCTAALHLSLLAAGLEAGDEVITTPLTFCATVNAIIHAKAMPVLADIDPLTMNISAEEIERHISPRTRAIVPVHFAGRMCDMERIMALAAKHSLKVIEDCAHAIEAESPGRKAGTLGDFGCFSFYVTKNVTTVEGGMVLARNPVDLDRIRTLALHGMSRDAWSRYSDSGYKHYFVTECGFKYNMTDLQASIGLHQLARVEENWVRRREIWDFYCEQLADLPFTLPAARPDNGRHALHLFTLQVNEKRCGVGRDQFLDRMTAEGIGVGVHYVSIAEHPFYRETFGWRPEDYPCAHRIGRETVSLPLSPKLTNQDLLDVVTAVRRSIGYADFHRG